VVPVGATMGAPYVPLSQSNYGRPFRLVYSGNLGRYHDFESLLDCAKKLSPEGFEFTIVGNGAKRSYILNRISDEAIDNVKVHEFLPESDYAALLASSDACFVTMEAGIEGTCVPSKFYSIMGAGRATLAAASSGSEVAYSIEEHDCGLVVNPGDPYLLEQALRELKSNPARTAEMGENGRLAYMDFYGSAETARSVFGILMSLAPKSKASLQDVFTKPDRQIERSELEERGRLLPTE
ncbi:MAG: glycosyltransferase, partial [Chlorobia bacterium]|nr:glycosyltransferase [Fimbriimonadaceae bacterium]